MKDQQTNFQKEIFNISNEPFPVFYISPKNISNKMIFYIPGLNGNGIMIKYWNTSLSDNFYLVSFDPRAQGESKAKSSRLYKRYLKDINEIIIAFKNKYNIDDVYIIGESWGSALASLYLKKYKNIKGIFIWNMPCKLIDVSEEKKWIKFKRNLKIIFTFLFFINTNDLAPFNKKLTNNKTLIRTVEIFRRKKISNKVVIASWRSFKPAWNFLLKNHKSINFKYIQSKEDVLIDFNKVNRLSKISNKIVILDKGYHILSFDENVNKDLFNMILDFTKLNN